MKIRSSILGILAAFVFPACNNPFVDNCSCTLMACMEGVGIKLENNPDPILYKDFSIAIAYGDTLEPVSGDWGSAIDTGYFFSSRKLVGQRPKEIGIRIAYLKGDQEKSLSLDRAITWTSSVCNQCSGDSPSCKDQMAHNAELALDLAGLPL